MSPSPTLRAGTALALLALASYAAAQVIPLDCATLPPNWYQDQDENDNSPWSTMAEGGASSDTLSRVYSTLQQRVSQGQLSAPGWTFCSSPTSTASGCTQPAGWGTNYALQANFTCGSDVLSVYALVNTFSSFVNVDDMTIAAVSAGGTTTPGTSASTPVNNVEIGLELDPANLTCSTLPVNWGDDDSSDDSDNGPWQDLSTAASQTVLDTVYSTLEQRVQEGQIAAIPDWAACDVTPTATAAGCQQTAGLGTNYALEVNYTCASTGTTLGLVVKVNTFEQNVNVDNLDLEFVAVNGTVVQDLDLLPTNTTGSPPGGPNTPTTAFSCSALPSNWGQDSDDNNGAWSTMPADGFTSAMTSAFMQRIGDIQQSRTIPGWSSCSSPETSAVGCTQSAGGGQNYAVQANITCSGITLGMAGLVNTYQSYTNLDDAAILFVASNGAITTGSFNPDAWYMPETDIFGRQYNWRGNDDD